MDFKIKFLLLFLFLGVSLQLTATESSLKLSQPVSSKEIKSSSFYLEASELPLWQVCQELSLFFKKNIVVYKDSKDVKISCNIQDLDLVKSLNLISWLSGVEWYEKDSIYYLGGNKDYVEVLDNTGISSEITSIFDKSAVKIVDDKIIVSGSEREVKRISAAIKQLQKKDFVTVHVWGYEVTDEKSIELGLDIQKALSYSVSWEGLIASMGNPIQDLVLALNASLKANQASSDLFLVIDTQLTCVSGKKQRFIVGEELDRELYTTSSETGTSYVSSYSTLQTGYTLNLSCYKYSASSWFFDISIDNSSSQTDNRRDNVTLSNTLILDSVQPALIGRMIKHNVISEYKFGLPFFSDIPYIGYLFRVTTEKKTNRNVLFFMQVVDSSRADAGATAPPERPNSQHLLNLNFNMQSFFE